MGAGIFVTTGLSFCVAVDVAETGVGTAIAIGVGGGKDARRDWLLNRRLRSGFELQVRPSTW